MLALALAGAMQVCAQQPHAAPNGTDRPPDFSCPSHPLDFTREELEQKALAELERRGGKAPPQYHTTLKRWGCDWWVFILQQPHASNSDFGVLVDGISGSVKQFVRGRS